MHRTGLDLGLDAQRPRLALIVPDGAGTGPSTQGAWRKEARLSERFGSPADDLNRDREPTSHERMAGQPWDASYRDGPPPWDIGRPQPAVVRLAASGGFTGSVLDAGCGTGENALLIASLGLSVVGIDLAEAALAIARMKAQGRGLDVEFLAADALRIQHLERRFDTVLDCGLFHTFDTAERSRYVDRLASVTEPDGILHALCFSDSRPDTGPHPVSREDLESAFTQDRGWKVVSLEPDRIETLIHNHGAPAWLAAVRRA